MKAIEFFGQQQILPGSEDGIMDPLPIMRTPQGTVTCYELTEDEVIHLLATKKLWITQVNPVIIEIQPSAFKPQSIQALEN